MFAAALLSPILCAGSKSKEGVYSQVIQSRVFFLIFSPSLPRASICLRPTELSKSTLSLIANAIRSLPKKPSLTAANRFTLDALLSSLLQPSSFSSSLSLYAILLSSSTPLPSLPLHSSPSFSLRHCVLGDRMSLLSLEST